MEDTILIARQPILDREQNLFAYELLFRKKNGENRTCLITDDVQATAQVLDNTLNNIGIDKLIGSNLAFINCCYDLLCSDILYMLSPEIFVIEILETVNVDDNIIEAVKKFKENGYKIAIDDFVPNIEGYKRIIPLLPYADIIKLEFPAATKKDITRAVEFFHSKKIKVLAEKIETESEFKECFEDGCDYFQGYFFSRPEIIENQKIDPDVISIFEIIKSIEANSEFSNIEDKFKQQPKLSVNLLKYLNSAAFAIRTPITSIKHAISLLGYKNLKRWLLILAYANKNSISQKTPLISHSLHRATFLENIAKSINLYNSKIEKAYLMGLISNLNALYKVSLENMLKLISIDEEISEALISKQGVLGKILELCYSLETNDMNATEEIISNLNISIETLSSCLLRSYDTSFFDL